MNLFFGDIILIASSTAMVGFTCWFIIASIRNALTGELEVTKSNILISLGLGIPWIPFTIDLFKSPYEVIETSLYPTIHCWALGILLATISIFFLSFTVIICPVKIYLSIKQTPYRKSKAKNALKNTKAREKQSKQNYILADLPNSTIWERSPTEIAHCLSELFYKYEFDDDEKIWEITEQSLQALKGKIEAKKILHEIHNIYQNL